MWTFKAHMFKRISRENLEVYISKWCMRKARIGYKGHAMMW